MSNRKWNVRDNMGTDSSNVLPPAFMSACSFDTLASRASRSSENTLSTCRAGQSLIVSQSLWVH
jgi:hypothetical protein